MADDEQPKDDLAVNVPGKPLCLTVSPAVTEPPWLIANEASAGPEIKGRWAPVSTVGSNGTTADPDWDFVELFPVSFCGASIAPSTLYFIEDGGKGDYVFPAGPETRTFQGVRRDFAHVLLTAEKRIFAIKQACGAKIGSPDAFAAACRVHTLIGYQFRVGLHRLGTAIDIDPELNPYIPTRLGDRYAGEQHQEGWNPDELTPHIFKPVVEVFDRACQLWLGKSAEVGWVPSGSKEPFDSIWERFYAVHAAVVAYLRLAFDPLPLESRLGDKGVILSAPGKTGSTSHAPCPLEMFCDRLRARWRADPKLQALHEDWHDVMADDAASSRRASRFESLYRAVVEDHDILRRGWVRGSPKPLRQGGKKTGPVEGVLVPESRDPCWGFLNLDYDVTRVLREEFKLRWGLVDFAGSSGDCMHFDLGGQGLKRSPPLVESRTAAQERTFYTNARPPVIAEAYIKNKERETKLTVSPGTDAGPLKAHGGDSVVVRGRGFTAHREGVEMQVDGDTRWLVPPVREQRGADTMLFSVPESVKRLRVRLRNRLPGGPSREVLVVTVE